MHWTRAVRPALQVLFFCAATLLAQTGEQQSPAGTNGPAAAPAAQKTTPGFLVVIDPAHGGDDKGAAMGSRLQEKDLTLTMARALKKEMEQRGIEARLLRDSDASMSLDHRAGSANELHPALYLVLHAGVPGPGIRIYTSLPAPVLQPAAGRFAAWEGAQGPFVSRSQSAAQSVAAELKHRDLQATVRPMPLRPLNNLAAPAIAVEVGIDVENPQDAVNSSYQAQIISAISEAVSAIRPAAGRGQP